MERKQREHRKRKSREYRETCSTVTCSRFEKGLAASADPPFNRYYSRNYSLSPLSLSLSLSLSVYILLSAVAIGQTSSFIARTCMCVCVCVCARIFRRIRAEKRRRGVVKSWDPPSPPDDFPLSLSLSLSLSPSTVAVSSAVGCARARARARVFLESSLHRRASVLQLEHMRAHLTTPFRVLVCRALPLSPAAYAVLAL